MQTRNPETSSHYDAECSQMRQKLLYPHRLWVFIVNLHHLQAVRLESGPPLLHLRSPKNDVAWLRSRLEVGNDGLNIVAVKGEERITFVKLLCSLPSAVSLPKLCRFCIQVKRESAYVTEELTQHPSRG